MGDEKLDCEAKKKKKKWKSEQEGENVKLTRQSYTYMEQ